MVNTLWHFVEKLSDEEMKQLQETTYLYYLVCIIEDKHNIFGDALLRNFVKFYNCV